MGAVGWGGKGSYKRLANSYTHRGVCGELGRGQVQEEKGSQKARGDRKGGHGKRRKAGVPNASLGSEEAPGVKLSCPSLHAAGQAPARPSASETVMKELDDLVWQHVLRTV